jgi:uncharacterized membrane protein
MKRFRNVRQREHYTSENYVVLFTRTLLLLIFISLLVSQSLNTVWKIANCFLDIIIIRQFDFGRDAKKILGFEHISSKIRDIEKNVLLIALTNVQNFSQCVSEALFRKIFHLFGVVLTWLQTTLLSVQGIWCLFLFQSDILSPWSCLGRIIFTKCYGVHSWTCIWLWSVARRRMWWMVLCRLSTIL